MVNFITVLCVPCRDNQAWLPWLLDVFCEVCAQALEIAWLYGLQ